MRRTAIGRLLGEEPSGTTSARRRLVTPGATVVLAVLFGAGLLGLAGWFIAASAVAGLAVASTFSFLFPSAGVQALAWARTLARYGERTTTHKATLDLAASLQTSLFARALRLPRDHVADLRSSDLLGRITVDSDAVENLVLRSSFPLLAAVAALVGAALFFAVLSPALAVVMVAGATLTGAATTVLAHVHAGRAARRLVAARAGARYALIEAIEGLPELRSFGAGGRAAAAVSADLERLGQSRRRLGRLEGGGRSVGTLLADLTLLVIVATAAGALDGESLSAPVFVAVGLVALAAFEAIVPLSSAVTARARARAACARLNEAFPEASAPASTTYTPLEWPVMVEIGLEDEGAELALEPGTTVLITGPSGTGKSTILRALSGQPARSVDVRLGGVETASIDPHALASHVTLVAQDAHIFDGTVRENLLLADPGAGEPELWRALAAAGLDDSVAAFPAGLDTPVGPGGAALSGGQRRRLSVAQGLLRRAEVLLLDEPTEALDARSAERLLAGVREFDPSALLVIALHDRQSPQLPWSPDARVELARQERPAL